MEWCATPTLVKEFLVCITNMKAIIPLFLGLYVVVLNLLGHATWILVLLNLLWLFFKGGILISWWIVGGVIGVFAVMLILAFAFILWAKS